MKGLIFYKGGYKYQLDKEYSINTGLYPSKAIYRGFITLYASGHLVIKYGYAWDGPSGPTIDTKSFMRGSLVHDALYQLIRDGGLPEDPCRKQADDLLRKICIEDGMTALRAWWVYKAVRFAGKDAALRQHETLSAP